MTDQADDESRRIEVGVTFGFDAFGDPLIHLDFPQLQEDEALQPEHVEQMALTMLRAVASARVCGSISRAMLLNGRHPDEAVAFLAQHLPQT